MKSVSIAIHSSKKIQLLLLFLIFINTLIASEFQYVETVNQQSIPNLNHSYNKANAVNDFEACYHISKSLTSLYKNVAIDSALIWANKAVAFAEKINDPKKQLESTIELSSYQFLNLEYGKSAMTIEAAEKLQRKHPNDSLNCLLLYRMGECYEYTGRPEKGMDAFNRCYQLADSLQDLPNLIKINLKLGNMQKVTDNFVSAIGYFKDAMKAAEEIKSSLPVYYYTAELSLLSVYAFSYLDDFDVSAFCSDIAESLEEIESLKMKHFKIHYEELQKFCYIKSGDRSMINKLSLIPINKIVASKKDAEFKFKEFLIGAHVAFHQNKFEKALEYSIEAIKLSDEASNIPMQVLALDIQKNIYTKQGDYENANISIHKMISEQNRLKQNTRMHSIAELEDKINILEQTKEREVQVQQQENLKKRIQRNYVALISLAGVSGLLFFFWRHAQINAKTIKKQNITLAEQKIRLQELNQTKDKILSIIGHDLKKPSLAFRGISKKINYLIKENDTKTLQALGGDLENTTRSMNGLLDNLLAWSQIQNTFVRTSPIAINIKNAIENIAEAFSEQLGEKNMQINLQIHDELLINIDPKIFKSIVLNILNNAIKFSNGGTITITAKEVQNKLRLDFKDEGIGMTKEQLNSAFEIVEGKSKDGTKGEKGTGIGLFLVNEMAKQCKANLDITSTPGKGTKVELVFPKEIG